MRQTRFVHHIGNADSRNAAFENAVLAPVKPGPGSRGLVVGLL
jgi:hypothetical protein